ncbi:MFS transporter [Arsenophonus nasoniae]|uniref:Inner membrane transport protein YnfM n=1 Tax=Arsenophonus nasoniae TaxID=638 RepID=A0A4P7L0A1_9GAMM|nr:MFS transporter [Arsenophonus nasoniae]QBY43374.1 Inner membrane transport protein YnfM [Arsenophonus nasoniae]WGM07368.1 MFS transporter [Arsenophonus nasoniae]WGM12239.1 MFS transporter [Arsenophonus nasoniae]WGM16920.1 MFS transporter [Arsenophonus nasoniae]
MKKSQQDNKENDSCPKDNFQHHIKYRDALYIRVTLSFFMVGLSTFALLYFVQPILPILSSEFKITPAQSSMSLSLCTGLLALGLLVTGPLSDAVGRKNIMVLALLSAAIITFISAFMQSWNGILLTRALVGLALSGVAAVAMTYLSEEIHPNYLALSMGLYISGNSIGGMSGRLITGILTDHFSWRIATIVFSLFTFIAAIIFWRLLPPSQHFRASSVRPRFLLVNFRVHLRDKGLLFLFIIGFIIMGSFITLYNYIGYRLLEAPYNFSQTMIGLLSFIFLAGTYSASKAGFLALKYNYADILFIAICLMFIGITITFFSPIAIIILGMVILTVGFFAAHAIVSSWIGKRSKRAKAQASSWYLFSYYGGSSIAGTLGGVFWSHWKWNGIIGFIIFLTSLGLIISIKLRKI